MKNIKINAFKIAIAVVLLATTFNSCKKDEVKPTELSIQDDVNLDSLKIYMAKLIGSNPSKINYDENRKMFSESGINQISLEALTKLYKETPIMNYRNGVPVMP